MSIIIGKQWIENKGVRIRLCTDITMPGSKSKILYYEFEKEYEPYICMDVCDAFLTALINEALYLGEDVICESDITEELFFKLTNYYIPVMSSCFSNLKQISIKCNLHKGYIENIGAVGTGNSGGVDSFYSLLKYGASADVSAITNFGRINYAIFNNISTQDTDEERIKNQFFKDLIEKKNVADELGMHHIGIYTNLYQFYTHPGIYNYHYSPQYISCALVLPKLFGIYYLSSGYSVRDFSIDEKKIKDGSYFDLFILSCFSTRNIVFLSAGTEASRLEKTMFISNNAVVKRHLQVCSIDQCGEYQNKEYLNCGKCPKCMRTMTALYSIGKLEEYKGVFDMTLYNKDPEKFRAYALAYDDHSFSNEVLERIRKTNLSSSKFDRFYRYYETRYKLRKNKRIHKLWRKVRYGEK